MITINKLRRSIREGIGFIKGIGDIIDAEIVASSNANLLTRLNYTSHIPCNGVEEPKSTESYGVGVYAVFKTTDGIKTGFGSEPGDLSLKGIRKSLDKARRNMVYDPAFKSLPHPSNEKSLLRGYHDQRLMEIKDEEIVNLGWRVLEGAIGVFNDTGVSEKIIIGGDLILIQERIAVGSTTGIDAYDETSLIMASVTSMIEGENTKGSGWATGICMDKFYPEEAGAESARSAIATRGGERIDDGEYNVIIGRQPVTDLMNNIIIPSLTLSMIDASSSAFLGKMRKKVSAEDLIIYDSGALPGGLGSKSITCEGLPTGRTDLIENGVIVGFLANHYYSCKILGDDEAKRKLGVDPNDYKEGFVPRNGFRFETGGGRSYRRKVGISPTNVMVDTMDEFTTEDLFQKVGNGVYIGRIWYTYPMNGLGPGDFTSTIIGDSYLIKNGKLSTPIKPNTIRINDNINNLLMNITGITRDKRPTIIWAADEVVHAPEIAMKGVKLSNIVRWN
ncbi:MAG: TldD/PmbA family protein [Nitrospinae bacterium]|nr:TldD/PmbA family protein [Nitrospinota bacterium]